MIRMAHAGNRDGVRAALENNLKSVDESLKQIEAIIKTARKQKLEFSATDAPTPVAIGNKALFTN